MSLPVLSNSLQSYIVQINRFPLLSKDEEFELAVRLKKYNDLDAAHKLITANLRFVVKIAMEYRDYGCRLADLVQEGNIGLMKAVRKFDPDKGLRLITYAVWWIRAGIQAFILKSWSLVSRNAKELKRRLFYRFTESRDKIIEIENNGNKKLEANPSDMGIDEDISRDFSLDKQIGTDETTETTHLDMLSDASQNQEYAILALEESRINKSHIEYSIQVLNEKERFVIENRITSDNPLTLQEIGDKLGITRERVRQIEETALKKLRKRLLQKSLPVMNCQSV
ncbi:MAG: RNA polymerase factor sigma-32 [Deltaproteobacteria bacterium]|nr:RNA polymerase factor sigma-32 [Deltaproteobacteria bacterium]